MLDLRCYAGFKTWKERRKESLSPNRRHGHAAENSEVLLPGLVAVAVRDCRFTTLAGNATVKLALPAVKPARPLPQAALSQLSSTLSMLVEQKPGNWPIFRGFGNFSMSIWISDVQKSSPLVNHRRLVHFGPFQRWLEPPPEPVFLKPALPCRPAAQWRRVSRASILEIVQEFEIGSLTSPSGCR